MRTVFLDKETQSEADLKRVGAWAYSEHPSTRVVCMSWAVDDGPIEEWGNPEIGNGYDRTLERLRRLAEDPETLFEAFNVAFEYSIWHNILVPQYGFPVLPPRRWRDTQAVACYYAMPAALDKLAKACGLPGKDKAGERLISKYSKLHLPTAKRDIPPEDFAAFIRYCSQDVDQERQAGYLLGDLPERELEIFLHDMEVNVRGIRLDQGGIETGRVIVQHKAEQLAGDFREITGLEPTQRDKVLAWFRANGLPELKDLRAETLKDLMRDDDAVKGDTRRALQLRYDHSKASTKKLDAMARQSGADGRARFQSRYHGAVTGRNTGTGFQPLNLNKGYDANVVSPEQLVRDIQYGDPRWLDVVYGNAMEAVGKASRHWIVPDDGCRIIAGDFTSIEAVVNAGLAGEEWKLQLFRDGGDPYCTFASRVVGREVLPKSHPNVTAQDVKDRQEKGKPGELAGGYQGWVGAWRKFDPSDRFTDEEVAEFMGAWRDLHPAIVASWRGRENAAIEAVQHPGRVTGYLNTGFEVVDGWLTMILIDGKRLWYRAPEIRMVRPRWHDPSEKDECLAGTCDCGYRPQLTYLSWKNQQFIRVSTYGGKLCLAGDTKVLTDGGWKDIVNVQVNDLLWDGEAWVTHAGVVCNGLAETVDVAGVAATPDHQILTTEGWVSASQSEGYYRARSRFPDGFGIRGERWEEIPMARAMLLRARSYDRGDRIAEAEETRRPSILRLPTQGDYLTAAYHSRNVSAPGVPCLAVDDRSLYQPPASSLEKLRRARDHGMRAVAQFFRTFLGRYGADLPRGAANRAPGQRRQLRAGKLSVGDTWRPGQQSARQHLPSDSPWPHDGGASFPRVRDQKDDSALAAPKRMVGSRCVYDIVNCGPNNRFVVRDRDKRPLIVHNCENDVQGVSRQILKAGELALAKAGYGVVLSVYDEIVCEVPDDFGSRSEVETIVLDAVGALEWASAWPISMDCWEGLKYKK